MNAAKSQRQSWYFGVKFVNELKNLIVNIFENPKEGSLFNCYKDLAQKELKLLYSLLRKMLDENINLLRKIIARKVIISNY